MSPQAFTCSLNLFLKLGTALLIGPAENCLQCDFQFRNCCWLRTKLSKNLCASLPRHDISRRDSDLESSVAIFIGADYVVRRRRDLQPQRVHRTDSLSIICVHFACRHCWVTMDTIECPCWVTRRAMCTDPCVSLNSPLRLIAIGCRLH